MVTARPAGPRHPRPDTRPATLLRCGHLRPRWSQQAARRAGTAIGLPAAALALAGCAAQEAAKPQARSIVQLWTVLLVGGGVVFAIAEGLIVWSALRCRRRDDHLPRQVHGNNRLETVWMVFTIWWSRQRSSAPGWPGQAAGAAEQR